MSFNSSDMHRTLSSPILSRATITDHYAHMRRTPSNALQSTMNTIHSFGNRRREEKPNAEDNVASRFELFILQEGEKKVIEEPDTRESRSHDRSNVFCLHPMIRHKWKDWYNQVPPSLLPPPSLVWSYLSCPSLYTGLLSTVANFAFSYRYPILINFHSQQRRPHPCQLHSFSPSTISFRPILCL